MKTSRNNKFLKGRFSALLFAAALALCAPCAQAAEMLPEGNTEVGNAPVSDCTIFRATADGTGDGSSWDSPMSWDSALAAAAADAGNCEIWLLGDVVVSAAPVSITFNGRTIVRGGFAGTESSADERSGAHCVLSANDAYDILVPNVIDGASLVFDHVDFTRAKKRAIVKSGSGEISFTNCAFFANGNTIGHNSGDADGNGFKASGGGSAKFVNCRFEGNGPRSSVQQEPGGCAIRAAGLARLTLDGCTFLTNGVVAGSQNADLAAFRGHTMYLTDTPLTMLNTRVSGSMGFAKDRGSITGAGGSVWLGGNCGGSVISNSVFSGNVDRFKDNYGGSGGGILILSLNSSDQRVDIIDSTFAYNFTHSREYGCLAVVKGDVHVTGSTFFDNILGYGNAHGYGADIAVGENGRLTIGHSHLTSLSDASITSVNPANLTIDIPSMTSGNPYLTTSVLDFEELLTYDSSSYGSNGSRNMDITYDCAALVGLDPTPLAVKPVKPDVGAGNVIYVAADAAGAGDGSSWANAFTNLSSAIAVASANKNEIWVKGNLTPSADAVIALVESDIKVYGGFSGTEASAAERAPGAMTTIDGADTYDLVKVSVLPGYSISFDGFNFTKARYRAVAKRGAGDIKFTNCRFAGNGLTKSADGRGIYLLGGQGAAKLIVENCVFEGNKPNGKRGNSGCGAAVYAMSQSRFFCDNTLVCSNGVVLLNGSLTSVADNRGVRGSVMFLYATPTTMRNTRIAANGGSSRESNETGGIVFLMGYSDGSAFTNCAFVGNWANNFKDGSSSCNTCGALVFKPSETSHTLDIENCTFAYNVSQANQSPGGLNVLTGDVTIHNSIFWRNLHGFYSQAGYANDIDAKAGSVFISHSMVTGTDVYSIRGEGVDTVKLTDTVTVADPGLVTSYESFSNHLDFVSNADYIQCGTDFNFAYLESIDAHLLSAAGYWTNDGTEQPGSEKTSAAIDLGDPESAYASEPSPNGGRVNLGAYGNTAQASKTPLGQPSVESFNIVYPGGYTRPQAELKLGLAEGTAYFASVTIVCKTNDVVIGLKTFENCQAGDLLTMTPPYYFPAGTELTFEYEVSASGATPCAASTSSAAQGEFPPFYGKGGGANVIHVREGANCLMNGSDWVNAYPDVESALAAIGSGKTEIWIAKETTSANGVFTLVEPLAIRGGFAGIENSAKERTGEWNTKFDMLSSKPGLEFTNGAGCPLELDRITITRSTNRGLKKDGKGALVLNGCTFSTNGLGQTYHGRGIYVSGGCVVAATNCLFEGNYCASDANAPGTGAGAYITSCAKAIFSNCRFQGNGIRYSQPNTVKTSNSPSSILCADVTPLFCYNVRFAANRANYGGVVELAGNCDGSFFENCAFVGNFIILHWGGAANSYSAPLCVNMGNVKEQAIIRNCTFAYNLNSNRKAPAGLLVNKGKVVVEDSIFWGNRRSSHILPESDYPAPEDINVTVDGYLALTNVFLASTYTGADRRHCLQIADESHLTTNNIITGDAMLASTVDEVSALMITGSSSFPDLYYPASAAAALAALNVHLRGGSGYYDENTGSFVKSFRQSAVGGSSPALDASTRRATHEPKPDGRRVNLGCYGNTPWATLSAKLGFVLIVR